MKEETADKIVKLLGELVELERKRLAVLHENQQLAKERDERRMALDEKMMIAADIQMKAQEAYVNALDPKNMLPGLAELSIRGKKD